MKSESHNEHPASLASAVRNWMSMTGLIIVLGSLFAFLMLFITDTIAGSKNPYVGILTYLVSPAFTVMGVILFFVGIGVHRRQLMKTGEAAEDAPFIDLSRPRDRRFLWILGGGMVSFLFITAVGSYHSYRFTESVTFCGQACHEVMEPEMVTYLNGPHARVACVECHIGPGATWFVRSKLSGLHQVYATALDKYPRPVPTPIKNLRPARDTCEHCHWPEKFSGDMVRTYRHFLSDEENTEYSLLMLLKVGGGHASQGPVGGIHWHMSADNKVEYLATDEKRLEIPWVRLTDENGQVTEYRVPEFTEEVDPAEVRTMDCIDCHNRPAHIYTKPNDAVDQAILLGTINRDIPGIRAAATEALTGEYESVEEAEAKIAETLAELYPDDDRIPGVVAALQETYRRNFFPKMNASWLDYPEHIGHKDWPGCARCHDDNHFSADGAKVITFSDCNSCHVILAQGTADELEQLTPIGQEFQHPGEDYDPDFRCNDCHTGGP